MWVMGWTFVWQTRISLVFHTFTTLQPSAYRLLFKLRGYKNDIILKLYRKLHTAVQSSPRIINLTGQFSLSKFGLKEARIRPNLCRHKMITWLSLKSNLYADGWRVVKVWKTNEIRVCQTNVQPMTHMFFKWRLHRSMQLPIKF
jgi:hypothetical protein